MTNDEYKRKYPIGTKVKYIGNGFVLNSAKKDIGKCGIIVGYWGNGSPNIYLPESSHIAPASRPGKPVTWGTGWCKIKMLPQKNEQLLFSFMSE